jgi:peptidoglycan/LPS O-acetylase OafA/YrhL
MPDTMNNIEHSITPMLQSKYTPHDNPYRPDIDGLRAVAVLAVVWFHAFPDALSGGFVGVDIFFVISGFLITTIIVNGLEQGKFRFADFYGRRIKRIFPALLLVLIVCLGFGWFALLADEYKQLGKHVAGGAGFIANLLFWKEAGYFDNSADTKPLLHLWSLGVEEQFYMLWPVMLWAAWRKRINFLSLIVLVLVVSFTLNIARAQTDSVGVFYGLHTRGWELLIGAFLAHISQRQLVLPKWLTGAVTKVNTALIWRDRQARAPRIASVSCNTLLNLASTVGAFLLLLSFVMISKVNSFPGWWALLPTLGSALLIGAGAQAWFNRTVLANRAMVWIGLISFPLYLWHWPLLSFARIIESETPSHSIRLAAIGVAFVFAWLTYQLIERQIRFTQRRVTVFLLLLMVSVGMTGGGLR